LRFSDKTGHSLTIAVRHAVIILKRPIIDANFQSTDRGKRTVEIDCVQKRRAFGVRRAFSIHEYGIAAATSLNRDQPAISRPNACSLPDEPLRPPLP
jgi:hypothetical protein